MTLATSLAEHPKTHLIFDVDETLFDLRLPWHVLIDTIRDHLTKTDPEPFQQFEAGTLSYGELQNAYVRRYGVPLREFLVAADTAFERQYLGDVGVNDELLEFIRTRREYTFFLWSSNTRPVVTTLLARYGIHNMFQRIVTRQDIDFLKPDPEGFSLLAEPGIPATEYLLIGDSASDREAAANAGIDFFAVETFH